MWWMWIVGPILVGIVYVVTAGRDRRIEAEVERFRTRFWPRPKEVEEDEIAREGDYRKAPAKKTTKKLVPPSGPGAKRVTSLPGQLHRMVLAAGGGEPVQRIELVPKLAYLASMAANAVCLSDHQTVVGRLDDQAPRFSARPLPIVEGERIVNSGVEFKKDPEFMALFLTEATTGPASPLSPIPAPSAELSKKIRGFLSRPIRDALRDLPDGWLRVEDKAFALTIYGPIDAERINQLVSVADVIFAEYGADGGPSLFGDDEDDEDDEEAEAEAKPPPPPAKKGKPAKASGKPAKASR